MYFALDAVVYISMIVFMDDSVECVGENVLNGGSYVIFTTFSDRQIECFQTFFLCNA